jgi:hypothetical protein
MSAHRGYADIAAADIDLEMTARLSLSLPAEHIFRVESEGPHPSPPPRKRRAIAYDQLQRALIRSWPRTISRRVVPANARTHHPWPQK